MSEDKHKTKNYEELSKCPEGGRHFLVKEGDLDWKCRKCKKFFTEDEAYFMDRE